MYSSSQNFLNLVAAAQTNDLETVRDLMWGCNPKDRNSLPFITAARFGHLECLEALKTVSEVAANDAQALTEAALRGHLPCVKFLWKLSIPSLSHRGDKALAAAAGAGHLKVVQYMLEKGADPHYKMSAPLRAAALHQHYDMVDFLFEHSSPLDALAGLRTQNAKTHQWQWFEEYVQAKNQKNVLNHEVSTNCNTVSIARKM